MSNDTERMEWIKVDIRNDILEYLRALTNDPHEHFEGMNECPICDKDLFEDTCDKIVALRKEISDKDKHIANIMKELVMVQSELNRIKEGVKGLSVQTLIPDDLGNYRAGYLKADVDTTLWRTRNENNV